jgi:hypothetical protein
MKQDKKRMTSKETLDLAEELSFLSDNWREWAPRDRRLFCSDSAQRLLSNTKRFNRIADKAAEEFWKGIKEHNDLFNPVHIPDPQRNLLNQ